jgi:hypothetical protein
VLSRELRSLYGLKVPRLLGARHGDFVGPVVRARPLDDAPLCLVQVRRVVVMKMVMMMMVVRKGEGRDHLPLLMRTTVRRRRMQVRP